MDFISKLKSKILAGLFFGFLVFIIMLIWSDLSRVENAMVTFDWSYFPLVLVFVLFGYLMRFIKWHLYMKELDINISVKDSARIFFSGLAMAVTPGKFGEVLKSYLLNKVNGTDFFMSAPTVIAERVTDMLAMLFIASFGVSMFGVGKLVMVIGTIIIITFLIIVSYRPIALKIIDTIIKVSILKPIGVKLKVLYESTYVLLKWKVILKAFIISVISWGAECLGLYLIFRGYHIALGFVTAAFVFSLSSVAGGISMLPGGLGVTEGSMLGLLLVLGVDKTSSTGITLLARFGTLWFGVAVGMLTLAVNWKFFDLNNQKGLSKIKQFGEEYEKTNFTD
jgi:uncharacterized protein (TIRG00374 family)